MNKNASCQPLPDAAPHAPFCERCDRVMKLVRTIPKLGGLPQLNVYRCADCGTVKTVEFIFN